MNYRVGGNIRVATTVINFVVIICNFYHGTGAKLPLCGNVIV